MSFNTAADVSHEINELDQAVRVALAEGNIFQKMRELTPRIKGLFATKKASNAGQGIGLQQMRAAFTARAFLWDFAISWAKEKDSDPDFINTQRTRLATFDGPSAVIPPPTSASGSRITKPAPASPPSLRPGLPVPEPLTEASRQKSKGLPQPAPVAQTEAEADASLAARRGRRHGAAEAAQKDGQPPDGNNLPEMRPKPQDDANTPPPPRHTTQPPKRRRIPVKGDLNDVPCVRCMAHSLECYGQAGRGRGACWNCGKSKLKCSNKGPTPMDEDDPTAESTTAAADSKPRPKPRQRSGRKLKAAKTKSPKSPATVPESEDEIPGAEGLPTIDLSAGPSVVSPALPASASAHPESPPRFTALEKGKGKEGDNTESDADADRIVIPLDLQVVGLSARVAELEDTVETLSKTVRQLAKVVTTKMTALELKDNDFERLEDEVRVIKEHFGLANIQHIQLFDGLQPELVTNVRGSKRVYTITNPYHDEPHVPFELEVRHVPHPANLAAGSKKDLLQSEQSASASAIHSASVSAVNQDQPQVPQTVSASASDEVGGKLVAGNPSASASASTPHGPAAQGVSEGLATAIPEDPQPTTLPKESSDAQAAVISNAPSTTPIVEEAAPMPPPTSEMPPPPVELIPPTPQNSQEAANYTISTLVPSNTGVVSANEREGESAKIGTPAGVEAEAPSSSSTTAEAEVAPAPDVSTAMDIVQPIPRAAQLLTPTLPLATTGLLQRLPSPARARARLSPIPPEQLRRSPRFQSLSPGPGLGSTQNSPSASGSGITRRGSASKRPLVDDIEGGSLNKKARHN